MNGNGNGRGSAYGGDQAMMPRWNEMDLAAKKALTREYLGHQDTFYNRPRDLPPFTADIVRAMLLDSAVRLGLAIRAAPLMSAEIAYKDGDKWTPGIRAEKPETAEFVRRQLARFWSRGLESWITAQTWGWAAGEVMLRRTRLDTIEYDCTLPRHSMDTRALVRDGEVVGSRILKIKDRGHVDLTFPKGYFHAHRPDPGAHYGSSILLGCYSPWADKCLHGGALDVRRLFMHKDAYGGADIGYPDGVTIINNIEVPNRDIALQIVEQLQAGGVTTRPAAYDVNGKELWTLNRATVPASPSHILEYPKDLDTEIFHGMEIPDDVIQSENGGAWAGKAVPMAAFYSALDVWLISLLKDFDAQVIKPLLKLNFDEAGAYEITHKPLAVQAQEQQAAQPGQPGAKPGDPNGPMPGMGPDGGGDQPPPQGPPGFGGQQSMSLDACEAIGEGVFSAAEMVEAARRTLALRMNVTDSSGHEHKGKGPGGGQFTGKDKDEGDIPAPKRAKEFGMRGPMGEINWSVDGVSMGTTPEKAIEAYLAYRKQDQSQKEKTEAIDSVLPKLRSGNYQESDFKVFSRFGKSSITKDEAFGILSKLGLRPTDAFKAMKAVRPRDTSSGGYELYYGGDAVEAARQLGFLPKLSPAIPVADTKRGPYLGIDEDTGAPRKRRMNVTDDEGHEHKGKGPGGGQFTSGGGGGAGSRDAIHPDLSPQQDAESQFLTTGNATAFRIHNGRKPLPKKSRNSWVDDDEEFMPGVSGYANLENAISDMLFGTDESVSGENYSKQTPNATIVAMLGKYIDGPGAEVLVPKPAVAAVFTKKDVKSARKAAETRLGRRLEARDDDLKEIAAQLVADRMDATGNRGTFDPDNPSIKMASAHAPAGGVTVAGQKFKGGEFIPGEVMKRASAEERQAIEGGEQAATQQAPSRKAKLAKISAKRIAADVQRYAEEHNEPRFAKAIGGASFRDNEPIDVVLADETGRVAHGIELKTMVDNGNNKITMKGSAMQRKLKWARRNKAAIHTVVIDDSAVFNAKGPGQHDESKRRFFYRRGVGSFRVGGMYEAKNVGELKRLLAMDKRQLPQGAR